MKKEKIENESGERIFIFFKRKIHDQDHQASCYDNSIEINDDQIYKYMIRARLGSTNYMDIKANPSFSEKIISDS